MEAGPAPRAAGPRCRREGGQRGCVGWSRSQEAAGRPTSNRPRRPRAEAAAKGPGIGRGGIQGPERPASRRAQREAREAGGGADACGAVGEQSEASMQRAASR